MKPVLFSFVMHNCDDLTVYLFFLQSHPGGLLFTKFGSNQTALLDLAFPVELIPLK